MGESLTTRTEGEIIILSPAGNVTREQVDDYLRVAEELIKQDFKKFIWDWAQVSYMDSTGIGFIFSLFTRVRDLGGELVFANASKKVEAKMHDLKLNTVGTWCDSIEEAKRVLSQAP